MFFGIPLTLQTFLSIIVVSVAIFVYAQNPVRNVPEKEEQSAPSSATEKV